MSIAGLKEKNETKTKTKKPSMLIIFFGSLGIGEPERFRMR